MRLAVIASLALAVVAAAAVAGAGEDEPTTSGAPSRLFDGISQDGISLGSSKAPAVAGAIAAAAARQDRLWSFTDAFYRRQGAENSGYATDDFLRAIGAATPGLDIERAFGDRERPRVLESLSLAERAADSLGADQTPEFYLRRGDGPARPVEPAALTAEAFSAALDDALARR
ncbi:MAG TPA: hypothetical protein VFX80_00420 [Solirubrobacteraceae bacterium]|nr:hypothetical protein [Solirubrobacteraceae bacterium]